MTTIMGIAQRILEENNFITDESSIIVTAQNILDENNWETADLHGTPATALTHVEYLMDNSITYINMEAGTTIEPTEGAAGSKTATLSRSESVATKTLTALMVRAYLDKGPNIGVSALSVSAVITDPQYALYSNIVQKSITRLKTANPIFVEYLITNAILIVNLHASTSIAAISGTAGNKNLTASDNEIIVVKLVASQFLQSHLAGKMGSFSLSAVVKDSIKILKGTGFDRA